MPLPSVSRLVAIPLVGLAATASLVVPRALAPAAWTPPPAAAAEPLPVPPDDGSLAAALREAKLRPAATVGSTAADVAPVPVVRTAAATPAVTGSPVQSIPLPVRTAYENAAAMADAGYPGCNLAWPVLAGIGLVESDHATGGGSRTAGWNGIADPPILGPVLDGVHASAAVPDTDGGRLDGDPRWDRAVGPMQFLPATWAAYGVDADGDGVANPQDIRDATVAAADYLCADGGDLGDPAQLAIAVYSYNHADWYVREVLAAAAAYAGAPDAATGGLPVAPVAIGPAPTVAIGDATVRPAIAFALAHLGDPYLWGGTGPYYDCSGLTQAAYASVGILIPRTSEQQWLALPRVTDGTLRPGDLVFFNPGEFLPGLPGHVGIYLGDGYMVDAPHTGATVRVEPVAGGGRTYLGAARPALLIDGVVQPVTTSTRPPATDTGDAPATPPVPTTPTSPPPPPAPAPLPVDAVPTSLRMPDGTTVALTPATEPAMPADGAATVVVGAPGSHDGTSVLIGAAAPGGLAWPTAEPAEPLLLTVETAAGEQTYRVIGQVVDTGDVPPMPSPQELLVAWLPATGQRLILLGVLDN